MRIIISLACPKCKNRTYATTKNKKMQQRLELKKYCRFCREHTIHKEVK